MKNKKIFKQIALERIKILFKHAELKFPIDSTFSNRYVQLARKIAMKYKVKIPKELKRRFCKNCISYIVPSKNCKIRLNKGKIVYTCQICKHHMRFNLR